MSDRPILTVVALLMAAALPYFLAVYFAPRTPSSRRLAWTIFLIGAVMRLLFSVSQPVLEDDYHRYLWDGALTAHGINPYTIRPNDAMGGAASLPESIRVLALESGPVLDRVNHPELGTIYPPVAQAAFAIAHGLCPWRSAGLVAVYYLADCAIFALVLALLGELKASPTLVLIYWWNPLCAKELYNSLHMDLLLLPPMLAGLLFLRRGRPMRASIALAFATAVKLWPILLMAPVLASLRKQPRTAMACLALYSLMAVLLLAPMVATAMLGGASGLVAYSERWEMNDALFMVFPRMLDGITTFLGHDFTRGELHRGGKAIAVTVLLMIVIGICKTLQVSREEVSDRGRAIAAAFLKITTALFLLSPTQFPWYFTWFAPLLVLIPSRGLLLLTFTLPLYYLKFYLEDRGQVQLFHQGVVWLEYIPVWCLLLLDWRRQPRRDVAEIL